MITSEDVGQAVLRPVDLTMVLLVREDDEVSSMPTSRLGDLRAIVAGITAVGVPAVKVFASEAVRTPTGAAGESPDCLMVRAITEIKEAAPQLRVMTETCLCSYTDSGECHLSHPDGTADLGRTAMALAAQAVTQAAAGADVVGPAAMAPGSVRACREALNGAGFDHVGVMPHLIVSSNLYAGYRQAMKAAPASGDRPLQINPAAAHRAVRMALRMIEDGADSLLLEPALFCVDILAGIRHLSDVPLLPFSVSGEYLSLRRELLEEEFTMLLRAGATQVITYAAVELADTLSDENATPTKDQPMTSVPNEPTSTPTPASVHLSQALPSRPLRLGCRTSHLARAYADRVIEALAEVAPGVAIELVPITTSGDLHKGDLSKLGGKGLFMKEIDKALTAGEIDVAVHCMKDVPGDIPLPEGLVFAAYLDRDDVRDCVVWKDGSKYARLEELPADAVIGTSAVRRKAQILRRRPDLQVEPFRGNVVPRLSRLDESDRFEAIVLAKGGLVRVGMEHRIGQVLTLEEMCPAIGAGVLGIQCRRSDAGIIELLQLIDHAETRTRITAERTMLHGLQGHCNSPIAGHCQVTEDGQISLLGMVFTQDGGQFAYAHEWDAPERAHELGVYVAATLARKGARDIIASTLSY